MNPKPETNVYPPRRGGSTAPTPASGYPRRGQPVERPNVDDPPKRGERATESNTPPRRPQPAGDGLPPRRPGSAPARPTADSDEKADLPPSRRADTPTHDVTAQPPRPAAQANKIKAEIEPDPEPEDPDYETNRQRLKKLLTDEWGRWPSDYRQEFEDTIVETVECLLSGEKTSATEPVAPAQVGTSGPRNNPCTSPASPTSPAPGGRRRT